MDENGDHVEKPDETISQEAGTSSTKEEQSQRLKDRLELKADATDRFAETDDDDEEFPWRFFRRDEDVNPQQPPPLTEQQLPPYYNYQPPPPQYYGQPISPHAAQMQPPEHYYYLPPPPPALPQGPTQSSEPASEQQRPKAQTGGEIGFMYFVVGFFVAVLMVFSAIFYLGEQMELDRGEPSKTASIEHSTVGPDLQTYSGTIPKPQAPTSSRQFEVSNIFGIAGSPIAMKVMLPHVTPGQYAFLIFRGMPSNISFSAGERFGDSWIVPIHKVDNLSLQAPASFQGTFLLEAVLIRDEESKPQRLTAVATIRPDPNRATKPAREAPKRTAIAKIEDSSRLNSVHTKQTDDSRSNALNRTQPKAPAQPSTSQSTLDATVEKLMIERGNKLLQEGDIAGARLLFEHLAFNNSKEGSFFLATTYDPQKLEELGVRGIEPDLKTALEWYQRSAALGQQDAAARISALTTTKVTKGGKKKRTALRELFRQFLDEETARVGVDTVRATSKQELFEKFLAWQSNRTGSP